MATLVQSKSGTLTTAGALTITLTNPTAGGNCLIVCAGATQSSANPTVSGITLGGSAGNFSKAKQVNTAGDADAEIWADPNCAGGQTSVVVTFAGGSGTAPGMGAWVMEWSGIAPSLPADKTNGATGGGGTWSSGSSGVLSQASEVIIGCAMSFSSGGALSTPGSPWTELGTLTAGTGNNLGAGYQVVSATTAQTYNSTISGSAQAWAAVIASFKTGSPAGNSALLLKFP